MPAEAQVPEPSAGWRAYSRHVPRATCNSPLESRSNALERMDRGNYTCHSRRQWHGLTCIVLVMWCALAATACRRSDVRVIRIAARPSPPTTLLRPGRHVLGLGRAIYRGHLRDGVLYVPAPAGSGTAVPLMVLLHGGGGAARDFDYMFPIADEFGVALLNLDARHNTWDGVDSPFGPDVQFIDETLRYTFGHVAIDRAHVALGGHSDGGMYALSVGRVNGNLFTHLIAVAPGFMVAPAPAVGKPRIFLAHGTRDTVYSVTGSRSRLLPRLRADGYDVLYHEFDGPHWMTPAVARAALRWFLTHAPLLQLQQHRPGTDVAAVEFDGRAQARPLRHAGRFVGTRLRECRRHSRTKETRPPRPPMSRRPTCRNQQVCCCWAAGCSA